MSKSAFRSVLFLALTGAGACAISDVSPKKDGEAPPAMEEVLVSAEEAIASQGNLAASAASYIANNLMAVGVGDSFELIHSGMSSAGQPRVRMAQVHGGVPVFGADVVVHSRGTMFQSVRGTVMSNLEGFDVVPAVSKEDAMASAKALYLAKVTDKVAQLSYSREKTNLVILPMDDGAAPRLAWRVQFYTELQGGVEPMLLNAFFDAKTGELVKQFNGIHTLSQASGPGGNAKVARTWTNQLDVEPSGSQFAMDTARLRTTNLRNATEGPGTIVTGPLNPIGDAAINDAHGFAEAVFNMMADWQGENSINENGMKLISRVHYGSNFENAFWDGTQMNYGDGASTFYPLSGAADVTGHEINHGFTEFHSNLVYENQSGGMNESFSDIAGEATEAYIRQAAPDMLVGSDIFKRANGALRYMCNPTQDGSSIDNLASYRDGIDVHYSSGIMNKAFCLAARRFASGSPTGAVTMESVKKVSRAFYVANDDFWTARSTFLQGCAGVLSAATQLGFTATEIGYLATSWNEVGVTGTGCTAGTTTPPGCTSTVTSTNVPVTIADNATVNSTLSVGSAATITSLSLSLNLTHTYRGDLVVSLISPSGTSFVVSNRAGGSADNLVLSNQALSAFNNQSQAGTWTLRVVDAATGDVGRINSWSLNIGRACPLN
jgi:vibriolysin